jgi:hypothetical protein
MPIPSPARGAACIGGIMDKRLSILNADKEIDLQPNKLDFVSALVRGTIGTAPVFGPIMAEVITQAIPDQRLERLTAFAEVLDTKLEGLREDFVRHKLLTEEGSDLYEDALNQAARATSQERKEYIASLLKNGLTLDDLDHLGKKKLLSILGELNDAEVLILKYHSLISSIDRQEFAEMHAELFIPVEVHMGCPQENVDKSALRETYKKKLVEQGLLRPIYKKPKKGELPEFDERTGMIKITGHDITWLGKLLLRYIDQYEGV